MSAPSSVTFRGAARTFHTFIDELKQKPDWQDSTMRLKLQYMAKAFDDIKDSMTPSLADEVAIACRINLQSMTPTIAMWICKSPVYQELEKASSVEKNISFPDWFFLASLYRPDHHRLRPYRD